MEYSYKKQLELSFAKALEKTREALTAEGFGIITEIDAKQTFKKKLDVDFENYAILGACDPKSALAVLEENKELGLMLPCNVIVYQDREEVFIATILPTVMLGMIDSPKLSVVAKEVEEKLRRVIDSI